MLIHDNKYPYIKDIRTRILGFSYLEDFMEATINRILTNHKIPETLRGAGDARNGCGERVVKPVHGHRTLAFSVNRIPLHSIILLKSNASKA